MLQLCVLPLLPESPRYLLIEKRDEAGAERGIADSNSNIPANSFVTLFHIQVATLETLM